MMRAAAIDRFGGPKQLRIHSTRVPEIDEHEILMAVHTAGVGPWDADMREGSIYGPPSFPLVLGTDGSGTVVAVGSRGRRLELGDHVYSYSYENPKGGFYAEYAAVAAEKVGHAPKNLSQEEAGAVPTTGLTALQGIDDALRVAKGESVVIHGASGGVGSLAIQFAKWRKARVLATAHGEDGLAFVRHLGADEAIDGGNENLTAAILQWAPNGVDAVLGLSGGASLDRCVEAVRSSGRVAYPNGVEPIPKRRRGIEFTPYDAIAGVREFERLNDAIHASKLIVPIAARYPIEEAVRAHERLAQGHVLGKIVLRIRDGV
jgi:NADPH:quinone reductase-like Zn-dependent oxidoreductase